MSSSTSVRHRASSSSPRRATQSSQSGSESSAGRVRHRLSRHDGTVCRWARRARCFLPLHSVPEPQGPAEDPGQVLLGDGLGAGREEALLLERHPRGAVASRLVVAHGADPEGRPMSRMRSSRIPGSTSFGSASHLPDAPGRGTRPPRGVVRGWRRRSTGRPPERSGPRPCRAAPSARRPGSRAGGSRAPDPADRRWHAARGPRRCRSRARQGRRQRHVPPAGLVIAVPDDDAEGAGEQRSWPARTTGPRWVGPAVGTLLRGLARIVRVGPRRPALQGVAGCPFRRWR